MKYIVVCYCSIITSFYTHVHAWCHEKTTPLCVYVDYVFLWHGTYTSYVIYIPCAVMRGIATHWSSHTCNTHARNTLRQISYNGNHPRKKSFAIAFFAVVREKTFAIQVISLYKNSSQDIKCKKTFANVSRFTKFAKLSFRG